MAPPKAKRLRRYLRSVDTAAALAALDGLWAYRQASNVHRGTAERKLNAAGHFFNLVSRIQGGVTAGVPEQAASPIPIRGQMAKRAYASG